MEKSKTYSSIGQNFIPLFHKLPKWSWTIAKRSGLFHVVGFFMTFIWIRTHKPAPPRTMADVFRIFYLDFLRIRSPIC